MSDEEKAALAAKDAEAGTTIEVDPLTEKDAKIAKLEENLENYKNVALKRLGKLPNDAQFIAGDDNTELTVADQIKIALLEKEIDSEKKAKDEETKKLIKQVSELKLALANRPQSSIGGDSTTTVEVKDNTLTDAQIADLTAKAAFLKTDAAKFIENFKKTLQSRG